MSPKNKEVFISDLQIPFQDGDAINIFFEIAKDFKPDLIWLGGDIIDDYCLSSYIKSSKIEWEEEIETAKEFLNRLRNTFPKSLIIYQEGNHEERVRKYILHNAKSLEFLLEKNLSWDELLDLKKLNIIYQRGPALIEKLYHIHGHEKKVYGQLVHVALNYIRWLHKSVIFGHWHVLQKFPIKEIDGTYKEAYANPCLFDPSKMPYGGYSPIDLFHRGFSLIYYYDGGFFKVDQLLLIEKNNHYLVVYKDELLKFSRKHKKNNFTKIQI